MLLLFCCFSPPFTPLYDLLSFPPPALTVLQAVKNGRGQTELQSQMHALTEYPYIQSQRVVIPPKKETSPPKVLSQETAVHFDSRSILMNISVKSEPDLLAATVQSKNIKDDLHAFTGIKPLIGESQAAKNDIQNLIVDCLNNTSSSVCLWHQV